MPRCKSLNSVAILAAFGFVCSAIPQRADAAPTARGTLAFTTAIEKANPPKGWETFCSRFVSECQPASPKTSNVGASNPTKDGAWVMKTVSTLVNHRAWQAVGSWIGPDSLEAVSSASIANVSWIGIAKSHGAQSLVKFSSINSANLTSGIHKIEITPSVWETLTSVNRTVNQSIRPVTDLKHFGVVNRWVYPDDGKGDCKAYTLLKRRKLIDAGFPKESLLITIVWTKQNQGHAVLIARTDQGDYVLDNLAPNILLWNQTTHDFVKRQSVTDPNRWVYIDGYGKNSTTTAMIAE